MVSLQEGEKRMSVFLWIPESPPPVPFARGWEKLTGHLAQPLLLGRTVSKLGRTPVLHTLTESLERRLPYFLMAHLPGEEVSPAV